MTANNRRAALVEKVALAMYQADDYHVSSAHAVAAIDLIRAEVLEEAARVAEHLNGWGDDLGKGGHANHIAAAIRALKDAP